MVVADDIGRPLTPIHTNFCSLRHLSYLHSG